MTKKSVKRDMQGSRVLAIIVGVLMVVLGIVFFVFPLGSMLFVDIFITIGLLILGIYRVIVFIAGPSGFRNGWDLALGLILVFCSILVLASNAASIVVSFAFLLGFLALLIGINQTISYTSLKGFPGAGFVLASGIINILLAIFILVAPFMGTAVVAFVEGIYLCGAGVALIIEGFSKKSAAFLNSLD